MRKRVQVHRVRPERSDSIRLRSEKIPNGRKVGCFLEKRRKRSVSINAFLYAGEKEKRGSSIEHSDRL